MLSLILDTAAFVLMAAIATHSIVLHVRLRRFRHSLADVGEMLLTLDASVVRMTEVSHGFSQRLQAELEAMDGRVEMARQLGSELEATSRGAAATVARLERVLRQQRQAEAPRTRAEPKGFAERFSRSVSKSSESEKRAPEVTTSPCVEDELQPAVL